MTTQEVLAVGMRVRVEVEPACKGEFRSHGIRPYVNGLVGTIERVEMGDQHAYKVMGKRDGELIGGYFTRAELIPCTLSRYDSTALNTRWV